MLKTIKLLSFSHITSSGTVHMLRVTEPKVIINATEHLGRVGVGLNWQKSRIGFVTELTLKLSKFC